MLSLRSIARSAPRTVSRLAAQSSRASVYQSRALLQQAWRQPAIVRMGAAFSTTARRPQVVEELVAKLDSEIRGEKDSRNPESYSDTIEEYLKESGYQIHDTPGQEEVILTRKFGDENIQITFSIADLTNSEFQEQLAADESDRAYLDEEDDLSAQSGGANTKGSVNQGRTSGGNVRVAPEDRVAPADRPELDDESFDEGESGLSPPFPARVTVKVTRESQKGAMLVEAVAQDGEILIENVYFFSSAEHADPANSESEWQRKGVYAGPPFGNLDEDLQVLLERYLEERGINTQMALFVPDYIDFKEQKEYIRWLENMKGFLA